jgi:BirA family biotin operon repressor/biotin-[acetyl-CoA-carboxylase] ligase
MESIASRPFDLKWPNDILRSGRKVAGILCERSGEAEGRVVVGIGINVRRPPRGVPKDLERSMGFLVEVAAREVEEPVLAGRLVRELRQWATGHAGPLAMTGSLREEWDARDCLRGRFVDVEGGGRGICRGVSAEGALLVEMEDGRVRSVRAGTVRLAGTDAPEPGRV